MHSALFGFVTKHACDGQTDRQNYDSQNHASIAVCTVIKPNVVQCCSSDIIAQVGRDLLKRQRTHMIQFLIHVIKCAKLDRQIFQLHKILCLKTECG